MLRAPDPELPDAGKGVVTDMRSAAIEMQGNMRSDGIDHLLCHGNHTVISMKLMRLATNLSFDWPLGSPSFLPPPPSPEQDERQPRGNSSQTGMCKGPGVDGMSRLLGHVKAVSTFPTRGSLGTTTLSLLQK